MAPVDRVTVSFVDGPNEGMSFVVDSPAPEHLKLAIPEWVVYRRVVGEVSSYQMWLWGDMAKVWRDPVKWMD